MENTTRYKAYFDSMITAEQVPEVNREAWYKWWKACGFADSFDCPQEIIRDLAPYTHASCRAVLWRATRLRNIVEQAIDKKYSREAAR